MKRAWSFLIALLLLASLSAIGLAQRGNWFRGEIRPEMVDRNGVPVWNTDEEFKADVFTFARVRYSSYGYGRRGGNWATDYPDSDLNFSFRLHELTSIETDPYGKILDLTDPAIFDYPFLYMIEPGRMALDDAEVRALRRYCYNGGFLMVDDFWGEEEWFGFYENIKRVFPDREPIELPITHEVFSCVYRLKEKPQVPAYNGNLEYWASQGITWEDHGPGSETVHFKGIFDDHDRMMVIICHNTDIGDGWEREGNSEWYFHNFCENKSYPMGINIVTYALTH